MKTIKTTLLVILTAAIWGLVPAMWLSAMEPPTCTTDSDCQQKFGGDGSPYISEKDEAMQKYGECSARYIATLTPDEQSSLWPYCPTGE